MRARNAVQLYSFRNNPKEDFPELLKRIRSMGFEGVEFAGYYGYSMQEIRSFLEDAGLIAQGAHVSYESLKEDLDNTIEQSIYLSQSYIICPHLEPEYRKDLDAVLRVAEDFAFIGEKVKEAGLTFGFHTEYYHFDSFGGRMLSEIILDETDPETVKIQLDTGNGEISGNMRCLPFMDKYPDRCELLHIKDYKAVGDDEPVAVGDGVLDLVPVIMKGNALGCTWYTVEYEGEENDVSPAVARSIKALLDAEAAAASGQ